MIEVDGEIHKKRVQYDKERTLYFTDHGISVVRYWNNEVLINIDNTYRDLLKFMKELESQKQSFKSTC